MLLLLLALLLKVVHLLHELVDILLVPASYLLLFLPLDFYLVFEPVDLFLLIMQLFGLLSDLVVGRIQLFLKPRVGGLELYALVLVLESVRLQLILELLLIRLTLLKQVFELVDLLLELLALLVFEFLPHLLFLVE